MGVSYIEHTDGKVFLVADINAAKCATYKGTIDELGSCFNFPYGDFNSWAILDDCMKNLDWLKQRNFVLRVKNIKVLERKSKKFAGYFKDRLDLYKACWNETKQREQKDDENNFVIEFV